MSLYKFDKLKRKMDTWGFPKVQAGSGFKVIRTDFREAFQKGQIRFGSDGIYLKYEGKEYRGYMYIKEPHISTYGNFPKFHLTRCKTIDDFINRDLFKIRYEWSNSNVNDLIDFSTRNVYKDIALEYCKNCRREVLEKINTTEDFYKVLDKSEIQETTAMVDIFGYDKDWDKISRAIRAKKEFTCENCGIKIEKKLDQRYLHVDHKNGDKSNNREANLKCLCVLCHAYKDAKHEENFKKLRSWQEVVAFVGKYRDQLKNNKFLRKFDSDVRLPHNPISPHLYLDK